MKPTINLLSICAVLILGISVGCAAPPYVPQPPPSYTGEGFTYPTDANVIGANGYFWEPNSTNWTQEFSVLKPTNSIPNVLLGHPSGTAHTVATFTAAGVESTNNPQFTNYTVVVPTAPAALTAK